MKQAPAEPGQEAHEADPFDRLYNRRAEQALAQGMQAPLRERWDQIVLFLLSSQDPDRRARYSRIDKPGPDSLGADAYELWSKMPPYMPGIYAPVRTRSELDAYTREQSGSMKRLMESRGLGERYKEIISAQQEQARALREQARRTQINLVAMGCAGIAFIVLMMLAVMLIIALRFTS